MNELLDAFSHRVFLFYRRPVLVNLLVRSASDVGDEVLEVLW